MHEFSIMQSTLDLAEHQTRMAGATQIHRLKVRIGSLSGVVPDALQFAFVALKEKTLAAGAAFEIESVPAAGWCEDCAADFPVEGLVYECPLCRQPSGQLRRGKEMELASLEIS